MPATISCALVCKAELQAGTTDCSGAVTRTAVSGSRALFKVDLAQYQGILLTVAICDPSGWVLHMGNSPTNDGNGGDAGQFDNDSEAQLVGSRLTAYSNDPGLTQGPAVLLDDQAFAPAAGCSPVTALISDGKLETRTPKQHTLSSPYIFRLDQPDAAGGPDSLIYVGLNRTVLLKSTRLGTGAKSATFCLWK